MSRVLLVGKGPPDRGGISAFMSVLLGSELGHKHRLQLLNLYRDEIPRGGRLTLGNVTRTLADVRDVWSASRTADIVHIHSFVLPPAVTMIRAGLLGLAAWLRGCRVIVHVHSGAAGQWLKTRSRRLLTRAALKAVHRLVVVTSGNHDALAATLGRPRVVLVDNGVDVSAFVPHEVPHDPPRILFVGVLSPRKGAIELLKASELLYERGVRHELWLAGGPPERGPEEERQVRAAAGARARFLGTQLHEAMPGLYRRTDIFCLPSWGEGMPLSILEAMASGQPVVATPVGDVPRAVEDYITGRLVPVRHPRALADALEPLIRDPQLRRAMGDAGRRRVEERFGLERMCAEIDELYRQQGPLPAGPELLMKGARLVMGKRI